MGYSRHRDCIVTLRVSGDEKELTRFDCCFVGLPRNMQTTERRRCFNALVPMPDDIKEDVSWPEWAIANWGTPYDIHDGAISFIVDGDDLHRAYIYNFVVRDTPPLLWVQQISSAFRDLFFSITYDYGEPRCFVRGHDVTASIATAE